MQDHDEFFNDPFANDPFFSSTSAERIEQRQPRVSHVLEIPIQHHEPASSNSRALVEEVSVFDENDGFHSCPRGQGRVEEPDEGEKGSELR